jgi:hypothetical protein
MPGCGHDHCKARSSTDIEFSESRQFTLESVLTLYRAQGWSAAEKPDLHFKALRASHAVVTAWQGSRLVGIANAISDGYLVVYYPHVLVHPDFQRRALDRYSSGALWTVTLDSISTCWSRMAEP